ncbi:MAG: hypothetical protein KF795_15255 [Labilithrix sp.]|nr:hypothetical protein [Labilithrix sp.]
MQRRWAMRGVGAKHAKWMAAVSGLVAGIDLLAAVRYPAPDMGGVIAKMMIFAIALLQLVPLTGFLVLAAKLRAGSGGQVPFWIWAVISAPILLLGAVVGIMTLSHWGLP